jgi:hypothetical protein
MAECLLRHPEDCTCDEGMFAADPRGHLVVVCWEDTTNVAAWLTRDELHDLASNQAWKCENVGWVTWADDDCIVLSARRSTSGERHTGLNERIPRRAITSMRPAAATADPTPQTDTDT